MGFRLRGQALAALRAAARQHLPPSLGGHAGAEAVTALPDKPAGLIGPLGAHGDTGLNARAKMKARGLPRSFGNVKPSPAAGRLD